MVVVAVEDSSSGQKAAEGGCPGALELGLGPNLGPAVC